ncbi:hypothetical protein [Paucibacter soli]|uniref:hypothetical protein n=1 Tax=Paucibacter soli TaxID=3133433 RepID=UPI0030B19522
MKPIRQTTLPINDLHALERALRGHVDPDDLVSVEPIRTHPATSYRSVHALMLSKVLTAADWESFGLAIDICERLIKLGAPITDTYGDGAKSQFCTYAWPGDEVRRTQISKLADQYVAAGLFDLEGLLDGRLPTRAQCEETLDFHIHGIKPLASAILLGNRVFVEYLLERNVDLDLGQVYSDEPPVSAVSLALAHGMAEIHALAAANSMQRQLASVTSALSSEIEMCAPAIPRTKLPVDDLAKLLVALDGQVDPLDLLCTDQVRPKDGHYRSVHAFVLDWFMTPLDHVQASLAYQCCVKLLAMNAPITDQYDTGATSQFFGHTWPTDPELLSKVTGLIALYEAAGQLDLEAPYDGVVQARSDWKGDLGWSNFAGLKPLAGAIIFNDIGIARFLIGRGVSLDLGTVYAGEPGMNAVDLALECAGGEMHALMISTMLKRSLSVDLGNQITHSAPAGLDPSMSRRRNRVV